MKAKPIQKMRIHLGDSRFADVVIWELPEPLAGSTHRYKYRLVDDFWADEARLGGDHDDLDH